MIIHQALHGYNQGHNLLSSSFNLPIEDEDYMKVQSDWTEYANNGEDDSSYIKAYTLPKSEYYVIAKSWYAYEMSRPGCVWTHSLIINLEDIDTGFDFRSLYSIFIRPDNTVSGYDRPIELDCTESTIENNQLNAFQTHVLAHLYYSLITHQEVTYLVEEQSHIYQYLMLSLLEYLPIDVVRKTSMCSGESSMVGDIAYNLAFSTNSKLRLEDASDISISIGKEGNAGVFYIANAIQQQENMVAQLVRTYSHDLGDDIIKIDTFGELLSYIEKPEGKDYHTILNLLVKAFPTQKEGVKIKKSFLSPHIIKLFSSMEQFYEDVCVNEYQDAIQIETFFPYSFVDEIIRRDFCVFQKIIGRIVESEKISTYGNSLLRYEADLLSVEWQKELFLNNWTLYQSLLNFAPRWLYNTYWLEASQSKIAALLPIFDILDYTQFKEWSRLLKIILESRMQISSKLKKGIIDYYPDGVKDCLEFTQAGKEAIAICYSVCEERILMVVEWVRSQSSFSDETVYFITQIVKPTSVEAKEIGSQSWYNMLETVKKKNDNSLYIYFYQLSFNWSDKYSLLILKLTFWKIHCQFADNNLSNSSIHELSPYLDELAPWFWWDNCKKLRKGLVRLMKSCGYKRSTLHEFTPDEDLNEKLLKLWDKA